MGVLICTPAVLRIDDNHDCRGSTATICGFNREELNPEISPKNELRITHHKRGRARWLPRIGIRHRPSLSALSFERWSAGRTMDYNFWFGGQ
eukprot:scaffold24550_cov60-Cyclotella_meneghiniana.AAC.13